MNPRRDGYTPKRDALKAPVVGSHGLGADHHHYGRRVEADGTWSIYHVFTGEPAAIGGHSMIGLSRSRATAGMLSLNRFSEARQRNRNGALPRELGARGAGEAAS